MKKVEQLEKLFAEQDGRWKSYKSHCQLPATNPD